MFEFSSNPEAPIMNDTTENRLHRNDNGNKFIMPELPPLGNEVKEKKVFKMPELPPLEYSPKN